MAGPGEYEIARNIGQSRKGVRWQPPKNTKQGGLAQLGTQNSTTTIGLMGVDTPGPGHYLAEKSDIVPLYKYKQSSVFASKVDRNGRKIRNAHSELGAPHALGKGRAAANVKSTNPLSPNQGSLPDEEYEDEYYDEEDDGVTPGPGAYFNP